MADIRMPDGTVIRNVPDGTPKKEVERVWREATGKTKGEVLAEGLFKSTPSRIIQGVADPVIGAAQLASRMYPEEVRKDIDEFVQRREENLEKDGVDWARLAGNVGGGALIGGAVSPAATATGRAVQSAAGGTVGGATAPVSDQDNFAKNKALQIVGGLITGGALGGLVEVGKTAIRAGGAVMGPMTKGGRRKIMGKEANFAAGDKKAEVIRRLDEAEEIVPGSKPIAGEAVAPEKVPEFAALQRQVESGSRYYNRGVSNAAARSDQVGKVAGTEVTRKAAEKAREFVSEPFYEAAFKVTGRNFKADKSLLAMSKNAYFKNAVKTADNLADLEGFAAKDKPVLFLHYVKLGLDKQLGKTGDDALSTVEKRAVTALKKRLTRWIGDKVPDYNIGREKFAEMSPRINQMNAAREMEKVLNAPIDDYAEIGKQQAAQFARSLREPQAVIRKSGVKVSKDLRQIFTKDQMSKMTAVAQDLARRMQYETQAKAAQPPGNIVTRQIERAAGRSTLPNALWRPVMIANAMLRTLQKGSDAKLEDELAAAMIDPKVMAQIMKDADIPEDVQRRALSVIGRSIAAGTTMGLQRESPGFGTADLITP